MTLVKVETPATYRTDAAADLALALGLPERAPVFVVGRLLADPAGRRMFHPFAAAAAASALETDPFLPPGDLYAALVAARHEVVPWTETVRLRMPLPTTPPPFASQAVPRCFSPAHHP